MGGGSCHAVRTVHALPPDAEGVEDGLAWSLFVPAAPPPGGVVVVHGADSRRQNHFDFARACRASGLAAIVFDVRGHGDSGGPLDGRLVDDVAAIADVLREAAGVERVALRGSSMGGYLAIVAARAAGAAGVVAICPATAHGLLRGVRDGRFGFAADEPGLTAALTDHDEVAAARALHRPLLLLHADGDEVVPVALSRALHAEAPDSRLVVVPGGDHHSIQHDPGLQGEAIRFLARALADG
jgi:pimeloyl-ACP methyl ester carboxylesterase